jgi:AcrR family transcriptional regulator
MRSERPKAVNLDNATVQRILAAALECWTRDGYHGASLKDVAEHAGVAKSLLHYHFASKEHLLIELQAVYSRRVAEAVRARLAVEGPSPEGALAALDQLWEAIVATRRQFPFALEVWRASLQNPAVRARLVEFDREIRAHLVECVRLALGPAARGLPLAPERLATLLHVAVTGFELRLFLDRDEAGLRRVFEDLKDLLAATLLVRRTRRRRS